MHGLMRSVWKEPPPPGPPARVGRDWALVGVLVPVAVLEGFLRPDLPWRVLAVTVTVALVPTLLWRRTRPLPMLATVFGVTSLVPLLTGGAPLETYTQAYLLLLVYALFRWGSGRAAVTGLALMLVSLGLSIAVGRVGPADAVAAGAVLVAAIALGTAFRYRSRARQRELDQVKLLEREQLARELHDTVAHHVSAMAIRAQAGLATAASRPDSATEALRVIEAEAARALAEMNAMVRVLRRTDPTPRPVDLAPGRDIGDLQRLAGRDPSGLTVDVALSGDLDDLPPAVAAAIYRVAQESVTNARRHARHATRVEVRVAADATSVRLRVSDDGEDAGRPSASPGHGLVGMTERAGLLGGTCVAGPGPGRGWTVTAVLPRAATAT
ncbi:sensor histidine kinase [Nonomuraea indica]|uniref:sensor histidine kinase n=1 Tax=Nonomuraea indica TaxID=1581193 RepID=UPI000C7DA94B|nr:histidine kinase [Nonomuraea indica]